MVAVHQKKTSANTSAIQSHGRKSQRQHDRAQAVSIDRRHHTARFCFVAFDNSQEDELGIQFNEGECYYMWGIPEDRLTIFIRKLVDGDDPGRYFDDKIRSRVSYRRVAALTAPQPVPNHGTPG